jgi:hypothetical protein
MAIVPLPVSISAPTYTITIGESETFTFVFDPLRYSAVSDVRNFLEYLKLGLPAHISVNESCELWTDRTVLRLGKLIMVRNDKLVREFVIMLEHALLRSNDAYETLRFTTLIPELSDRYPSLMITIEIVSVIVGVNISYDIPRSAITVTRRERDSHLYNVMSGDLGTLVLDFDRVRIKFVVLKDHVEIIFSDGTKAHRINKSRCRAHGFLSQLYTLATMVE